MLIVDPVFYSCNLIDAMYLLDAWAYQVEAQAYLAGIMKDLLDPEETLVQQNKQKNQ